jgi:hypothetical protein
VQCHDLVDPRPQRTGSGSTASPENPYETWGVIDGNVVFQAGHERAGTPVRATWSSSRAGLPHKFTNQGPRSSRLICIHANPTVIGEWLE